MNNSSNNIFNAKDIVKIIILFTFEIILFTCIGMLIGGSIGIKLAEKRLNIEAVEKGHAHWVVAPDGSTTFEWNKPSCQK